MRKHRFTIGLIVIVAVVSIYLLFNLRLFSGAAHDEKSVTLILQTLNVRHDFWQAVNEGAEAAAKEIGAKLNVEGPLSEEDAASQIKLLEEAIVRKPQAIVIAAIKNERMPEALAKAREAGIKLVIINYSPAMKPAPAIVSSNHTEAGKAAGLTAIEETSGKPLIAVISDFADSLTSEERLAGMKLALDGYQGSMLSPLYAEGSEERAYELSKQLLLSDSPINSIITLNASASQGAARALMEYNRAKSVSLIGFDSTSDEVKLLEAGIIRAAIVQKPFNMGYLGVKTALRLIEGSAVEPITYMDSNVITKQNMYTSENQKLLFPFINSK